MVTGCPSESSCPAWRSPSLLESPKPKTRKQGRWLLSVPVSRLAPGSLPLPGLAANAVILRYQKSSFYVITILTAARQDKSRAVSSSWKPIFDSHWVKEKGADNGDGSHDQKDAHTC